MENIKKEYMEWKVKHNISTNKAAQIIGIGHQTLSNFEMYDYESLGNSKKKIYLRINDFLRSISQETTLLRSSIKYEDVVGFVETNAAAKIIEVATICKEEKEIMVVYGKAGIGKTTALRKYYENNRDVIFIEADIDYRPAAMLGHLSKSLSINQNKSVTTIYSEAIERLRQKDTLLIIDEAENLTYKSLETLRRLHDKTGIGVLLCGLPRLISNLRGSRGQYEQLYSRVALAVKIDELSIEDVDEIVGKMIPDKKKLAETFYKACDGNIRVLSKLLPRAIKVAELNEIKLDNDIIFETANMLIRK